MHQSKIELVTKLLGLGAIQRGDEPILVIENGNERELTSEEQELVDSEYQVRLVEWNNTEYQRLRKKEYALLNQDELRYDDLINGTNTWIDAINAIKAKYPKPE